MTTTERPTPPLQADPVTTLAGWLDFYRATLVGRCDGLTDEQLRAAPVAPSPISLLGLVRHLAAVERNWFRSVLAGEEIAPLHGREPGTGHSGGFELDGTGIAEARASWEEEVAHARRIVAAAGPAGTGSLDGHEVSLVWVLTHVIAEYARHCGHADLVRERIDGRTGV
ncbi:DinB family protein [Pseudonocardia sp. HH130630-07]|uniref:DinB family protein n=1 Tax=Pseudonocardia sp. HH130630-07 TaxID=1690815 RepID=UPI000814BEBD|nr:DinB family protein [Pseudonocardia sp. HH130630-07]ANY06589.1 Mini-circle protein [Pseudonocardia sp. HH130630-07]